jgi:hypothetical protein
MAMSKSKVSNVAMNKKQPLAFSRQKNTHCAKSDCYPGAAFRSLTF